MLRSLIEHTEDCDKYKDIEKTCTCGAQEELDEYDALVKERDFYKRLVTDIRAGNYDNAHDITAARRYLFNELEKAGKQ